jgi:hypothetical protein
MALLLKGVRKVAADSDERLGSSAQRYRRIIEMSADESRRRLPVKELVGSRIVVSWVVAAGNTSKRRRVATENSMPSGRGNLELCARGFLGYVVATFYLLWHASAANTANNCLVVEQIYFWRGCCCCNCRCGCCRCFCNCGCCCCGCCCCCCCCGCCCCCAAAVDVAAAAVQRSYSGVPSCGEATLSRTIMRGGPALTHSGLNPPEAYNHLAQVTRR